MSFKKKERNLKVPIAINLSSNLRVNTPVTRTMDPINTTDIAVVSSPGADAHVVTLVYMCHLFGFMKEWLQEGGVSTDSAIVSDSDTTEQRENMFSDADCEFYYPRKWFIDPTCKNNSLLYVTHPEWLDTFTECITIHFMTEMGASYKCFHSYARSHVNTTVQHTKTLLSKDRQVYNFMVDTLNAGNICQATNDTSNMTFSDDNCYQYKYRKRHGGSKCTYDTRRNDTDKQSYKDCLGYRFLKSLGVDDSVCTEWTLIYMCHLFGFMKKWLQEESISTNSAIVSDSDTVVQRENMFSDAECEFYHDIKRDTYYSVCEDNSIVHVTHRELFSDFPVCIIYHFMMKMGASDSCSDDSVRSDIDTTVKNTMTLLSKNRLFYNFLVDTLDAENGCQTVKETLTIQTSDCASYIDIVKVESPCDGIYVGCLWFLFMKSLGADSLCQISLIKKCDWYYNMVQSLAPTCICVCGLIGNLLSLGMFGSGAIETPITYQLLWLAGVDIAFILTWWVVEVLPHILRYYNDKDVLTTYQTSFVSVLTVCLRPLSYVTRSSTVWLTVLIGLYRYLAVCHPYNKLTSHCTQHGHKYVILVVFLSFLYNIPYFCEYHIDYMYTGGSYVYDDFDFFRRYYSDHYDDYKLPYGFYALVRTGLVSKELLHIYSRIHAAVIVSLPCLVLFFVTVSILVELRKLKKKRSSMQTSQTSQNGITVMLVTILITFILCQLPYFVWSGFGGEIRNPALDDLLKYRDEVKKWQGCGSFMYYIRRLVDAGLLLNSSANGFIYFFMNKTFREALFYRCPCPRDEGIETIEMGPVGTRPRQDETNP